MMGGVDPSFRLMMGHLLDVIQTRNTSAALLMVTVVGLENTVPVIHVSTIDLLDSQVMMTAEENKFMNNTPVTWFQLYLPA